MIERLRNYTSGPARAVMFDFDGTLALVRAGWMPLMLDMMMETLGPLDPGNGRLREQAEEYVAQFTGKDTVHQMEAFAGHVRALGGDPRPATEYKAEFLARLEHRRAERLTALQADVGQAFPPAQASNARPSSTDRPGNPEPRRVHPDSLLVPGARALLETLRKRGLRIYLASGTAHEDICYEARLLDIDRYFDGIYGSAPTSLTKRELLAHIVESGIRGEEILTFGDGRVEIEDTRDAGGTAVGVATDEGACLEVDSKKRAWLVRAGADYIVPNFLDAGLLDIVAGTL